MHSVQSLGFLKRYKLYLSNSYKVRIECINISKSGLLRGNCSLLFDSPSKKTKPKKTGPFRLGFYESFRNTSSHNSFGTV